MSMYQVCIREVDKKSDRITPDSGELAATPDPRPSHLYIPNPRGWRVTSETQTQINPFYHRPEAS